MSYQYIKNLKRKNFAKKSVLIIGAGYIASEYAKALCKIGIKNVTIMSKNKDSSTKLCKKYNFTPFFEGYEKSLPHFPKMDLVIIATPVTTLFSAAESALKNGQRNILIEKPGSLDKTNLLSLLKKFPDANIRVGYNRLQYPNFYLLKELINKDGGITSCTFTFTEWLDRIDLTKYPIQVLNKWGIANSLHPISMAFELIGLPKYLTPYQFGKLDWHPTGSIFVGSGITEKNIPFSYHADWNSSGRWGIEIMTKNNAYRLIPLEELYICKKNTTVWKKISFKNLFPDIKFGLAEEVLLMLENKNSSNQLLISLENALEYIKIAEKIFGYDKLNSL